MTQYKWALDRTTVRTLVALIATTLTIGTSTAAAENHVLPLQELRQELAQVNAGQRANQNDIQRFFSEPRVRDTLKSVGIDSLSVARSATLLSPEEQATLASRVRTMEQQIIGGQMNDGQVTLLILCGTAVVLTAIITLAIV